MTRHRLVHFWWAVKIEIRTEATELKINRPQCKVPSSLLLSNYPFSTQKNVRLCSQSVSGLWEVTKKQPTKFFLTKSGDLGNKKRVWFFSKLSLKMRNCRFSHPKMIKCDTKIVTIRFLRIICRITPKRNTYNLFSLREWILRNHILNLSDKNKQLSLSFLVHKPPNTTTSPNGFSMESEGCPVDFLSRWSL